MRATITPIDDLPMSEHLRRLYAHLGWADERLGRRLLELGTSVPEEALTLFSHIVAAERIWLVRITGTMHEVAAVWPSLTLDRSIALAGANRADFGRLLEDSGDPGRTIRYRNTAGMEFEQPLDDILLHVALHGAYHRGQIARIIRQSGAEPVNTDYITWVREGGGG